MSYTKEELIEHVNAQIRRDEELHRETLECLEIKKELYVRQLVQKVVAQHGITLNDADSEQLFQECLAWTKAQPPQVVSIVVNEIQLGGEQKG